MGAAAADELPLRPAQLGEGDDLYLEVYINGVSRRLIAAFRLEHDGTLTIDADELREAGLKPNDAALTAQGRIRVAGLPGVTATYRREDQTIRFAASDEARVPDVVEPRPTPAIPQTNDDQWGALINYDLFVATRGGDAWRFDGVSAYVEGRLFGPAGLFSSTMIAGVPAFGTAHIRRLDTSWTWSDPMGPMSYRAGDLVTGGLGWTRPVRLGGIQIRRNFALRPDLITTPVADLRGAADVPSTVEVYVDGAQQLSADVAAGPFEIARMPLVTGAGTVRMVVRDPSGRETVSDRAFFSSPDMLGSGLLDFSAEIGFARRGYATGEDDYDRRLMAAGSVRYGLDNDLTIEAHAEGGGGLLSGGIGAIAAIGSHAGAALAAAASSYRGRGGYQMSASLDLQWRDLTLFARTQRRFGSFADIASVTARDDDAPAGFNPSAPAQALDQLVLTVPGAAQGGALAVTYTRLSRDAEPTARLIGANYSQSLAYGVQLFASGFCDLEQRDGYGVFLGVSVPFGEDARATISASEAARRRLAAIEIAKMADTEIGSWGWRLRIEAGDQALQEALVTYRARFGRFEAGLDRMDGSLRATGSLEGAVVIHDGVFFANRIDDAFAVVETGAPGVLVNLENRPAGRTGGGGKLLVTGLRAYEENHITIDPAGLPPDAVVGATAKTVAPADRSGAVVAFDVDDAPAAAIVSFIDAAGRFLEAGASGVLDGASAPFVVGYDGEAYLTGLKAENGATITLTTGATCRAAFAFRQTAGAQARIVGVLCAGSGG